MKTAIIGTGKIGKAIARKLTKTGNHVLLTNSRGAASLKEMAGELGGLARAADLKDIAEPDVIFLTVRWSQLSELAKNLPNIQGRILIDVTNPILDDGTFDDLKGRSASGIVQKLIPGVKVVKALNHYFLKWIDADPKIGEGRRAAFISGDDTGANQVVSQLLGDFGFHPIILGNLTDGGKMQQAGYPLAELNLVSYPA